jgi:hypothetical protein
MRNVVRSALVPAVLSCLLLASLSDGQDLPPQPPSLRTFFTVRSTQPDDSLPPEFRKEFEKDEGGPLKSVTVDLNGDGREEKVFLCAVPAGTGGRQWLVYDPFRNAARGVIVGTIVFIGRDLENGFPRLETYWKQGGDRFGRERYARVGTRALTLWETSEYFRAKPPLDVDQELVEIK